MSLGPNGASLLLGELIDEHGDPECMCGLGLGERLLQHLPQRSWHLARRGRERAVEEDEGVMRRNGDVRWKRSTSIRGRRRRGGAAATVTAAVSRL